MIALIKDLRMGVWISVRSKPNKEIAMKFIMKVAYFCFSFCLNVRFDIRQRKTGMCLGIKPIH